MRFWGALAAGARSGRLPDGLQVMLAPNLDAETKALRAERRHLLVRVQELEGDLTEAEERIDALERDLRREQQRRWASRSEAERLYSRVGLHPRCPDFLLRAARRAYRAALHPDAHPPPQKIEAEKRFKRAENTFDEIEAIRRCDK